MITILRCADARDGEQTFSRLLADGFVVSLGPEPHQAGKSQVTVMHNADELPEVLEISRAPSATDAAEPANG